ncbi:hypothetical protein [Nonomuraea sp. KM90]|uniref:hypothetical protein n=1 Tax=Nonomuraea sp. KM90 TaxID=3457428 RepID=UPI003FCDD865
MTFPLTDGIPQPHENPMAVPWPSADVVILRNRPLRLGTPASRLSRYGDDVWHLAPAHRDAHIAVTAISWATFPESLRPHFKAFFLAALDQPVPVDPTGRQTPGQQASIGTFSQWIMDMRTLAHWLDQHGVHDLRRLRESDLEVLLAHVRALERSAGRKADLLSTVRSLWLFRDHLPAPCRLECPYPWPGQSANELAGVTALRNTENKTPRIAEDSMQALLAWALVMIEQMGPDICGARREYAALEAGDHPSQAEFRGTPRPASAALSGTLPRRRATTARAPRSGRRRSDGEHRAHSPARRHLTGQSGGIVRGPKAPAGHQRSPHWRRQSYRRHHRYHRGSSLAVAPDLSR